MNHHALKQRKDEDPLLINRTHPLYANTLAKLYNQKLLGIKKTSNIYIAKFEAEIYHCDGKIFDNPYTILAKTDLIPYREILWGEIPVGLISVLKVNDPNLDEIDFRSRINLGLILDLVKTSLNQLSLNSVREYPLLLNYNSFSSHLITAVVENPTQGTPDTWMVLIQLDHQAIIPGVLR
jgi:hypothetical protein